jgi:hypothetical protein
MYESRGSCSVWLLCGAHAYLKIDSVGLLTGY